VPKAHENGQISKTSKSVARTSLRSCGIRTESDVKKWSIGSVGATPGQGPPPWIWGPSGQIRGPSGWPGSPTAKPGFPASPPRNARIGSNPQIWQIWRDLWKFGKSRDLSKKWAFSCDSWKSFFSIFCELKISESKKGGCAFQNNKWKNSGKGNAIRGGGYVLW